MRGYLKPFVVAMMLVVVLVFPNKALAQPGVGPNLDNDPEENNVLGTTTLTETPFDWRWLLPIIAVPLLYFAYSAMNRNDTGLNMKGGRAERRRGEDDDDFII